MSSRFFRHQVEQFLGENGLRMEALDVYCVIQDNAGKILAGAGLYKDIIKCIAVASEARSEGLVAPLVSHLISLSASRGIPELKLFTKPENEAIFESLGFRVIARAPKALLLENGRGLERYCEYLRSQRLPGRCGVVVMNANPFTLGHRYLLEKASAQVDTLFVIPVKEEGQCFPYAERKAMLSSVPSVVVLEGSDYQISAATFPTYFLKDLSDAAETHIRLDLDLFLNYIAPALQAEVRFVGSEPDDALTNHYNTLMKQLLPAVVEIPRLSGISASSVRKALEHGSFREASALCPRESWPYLLAHLTHRALKLELDTPGKPGLVGPDSNGAHRDMDYNTMLRGIEALRPFWPLLAQARGAEDVRRLGLEAEKAMLEATGGVNTHRGAIFCLGLTLNAWAQGAQTEELLQASIGELARGIYAINQPLQEMAPRAAMRNAMGGYRELFEDWLPLYASGAGERKTLLRIMSTLEDTCVLKRAGSERAQLVKQEAKALLQENPVVTAPLCEKYAAEGISPGGAADMLALTIFIHSIIS